MKAAAAVSGVGFHALLTFVVPLQLLNAGFSNLTGNFERQINLHNLFVKDVPFLVVSVSLL